MRTAFRALASRFHHEDLQGANLVAGNLAARVRV
jgi:hypothetical protein